MEKIKEAFTRYESASDQATDFLIRMLDAQRRGERGTASYIEKHILLKCKLQSYKLYLLFDRALEEYLHGK